MHSAHEKDRARYSPTITPFPGVGLEGDRQEGGDPAGVEKNEPAFFRERTAVGFWCVLPAISHFVNNFMGS